MKISVPAHPDFRLLFASSLVSLFSEGLFILTAILLVKGISNNVTALSWMCWMFILTMVPSIVLAPFAGAVLDRFHKGSVAMVCQLAQAVLLTSLAILLWTKHASLVLIYATIILNDTLYYILGPTTDALTRELLGEGEYVRGESFMQGAWQVGNLTSSLVAGTLPIQPGELPLGADPHRDVICHCALGSVFQVLTAAGRDVDRALPWIAPWFVRYQMADGGLSCDDAAYRITGECPSSMVGTVAPFEAMLLGPPAAWTAERAAFVERAAGFLIERRLMLGSQTVHNAEERTREPVWRAPCFPRFYLYDVLRGLDALVRWAELTGRAVPLRAIAGVLEHLLASCPDGVVQRRRLSYAGVGTWLQSPSGEWVRRESALRFPLLEATSAVGEPCPYLTRQWTAARHAVLRLIDQGRIADDV